MLARVVSRARATGRIVPQEMLEHTMEQVPLSVALLRESVDYTVEFHNGDADLAIVTEGETWTSFTQKWLQQCIA